MVILLWGFQVCSAASLWLTCHYSMSSATVWSVQPNQTGSESNRNVSSRNLTDRIPSVTSAFIHFLTWLSPRAGAPTTSQHSFQSPSLTFDRGWETGCWRKQQQNQSQHGGRRRKAVAGASLRGRRDTSASPGSFYRREGRLQTPRTSTKYETSSKWLTWERASAGPRAFDDWWAGRPVVAMATVLLALIKTAVIDT